MNHSEASSSVDRKKPRIVAFADSLGLPRDEPKILWEETWPYRLETELQSLGCEAEVINCSARARTADTLVGHDFWEHVELKAPDVVILQVGVVDCAPRIFSRTEKRVLNLPVVPNLLREWLIRSRSKRRAKLTARDPMAKVYTAPDEFRHFLEEFQAKLGRQVPQPVLVVLPIIYEPTAMEAKSPGYTQNATRYNSILADFAGRSEAIWLSEQELLGSNLSGDCFADDGYHLSPEGNRRLANSLAQRLARVTFPSSCTRADDHQRSTIHGQTSD
jgi:lysophospholipase L1-like esterase